MNPSADSITKYGYLAGRQSLPEFIGAVKRAAIGGDNMTHEELAYDWRDARAHIRELEATEAGWADGPCREPLPSALASRAEFFLKKSAVKKDLRLFPHRCCMVELDRLVVYQNTIDLGFIEQLRANLPASPSLEDIFQFVIEEDPLAPPISVDRLSDSVVQFTSISADLRYLDAVLLDTTELRQHVVAGRPASALGLFVGYSLNFLTAIEVRDRLILCNRTHHAIALRERGITHAPCIVRQVSHEDELNALSVNELTQNSAQYLTSRRPPVFKDYFDERLRKVYSVRRRRHVVEVQVTIRSSKVPA